MIMPTGKSCSVREHGFSIIELLVSFAILGLIITAIFTFYFSGLSSWNRAAEKLELQQTARIALDMIIDELLYASEVEIRNSDDTIIYYWTKVEGQLKLRRFRLSGEQLLFEHRHDNDTHHSYNVVALGISGLKFDIAPSGLVRIEIKAGPENRGINVSGSVSPRNKP